MSLAATKTPSKPTEHTNRPDHSGWGRSECTTCGLKRRPRMSDSQDIVWLHSVDGGASWVVSTAETYPAHCSP